MANLQDIEGIGPAYAARLRQAGLKTTAQLLAKGASPQGRQEIAQQTSLESGKILEWVNHADLYRIKGVGSEYADLLEASGVDSIPELAQRVPGHLLEKLVETNQAKKLVRKLPALSQVDSWVRQAKGMPRIINY